MENANRYVSELVALCRSDASGPIAGQYSTVPLHLHSIGHCLEIGDAKQLRHHLDSPKTTDSEIIPFMEYVKAARRVSEEWDRIEGVHGCGSMLDIQRISELSNGNLDTFFTPEEIENSGRYSAELCNKRH